MLSASILLAGMALAAPQAETAAPVRQKDFTMRLYAPFLEPALGATPAAPGDELLACELAWTGPSQGVLKASQWRKTALISYTTTPDRKTLLSLTADLGASQRPPGQTGEDVWRHRHGYLKHPSRGYLWNKTDVDPVPFDAALGAQYDALIMDTWSLWARPQIEKALAGKPLTCAGPDGDDREWRGPITMRYDDKKLVGTPSGEIMIRLWHAPVRVRFTLKASEPSHHNPWIIDLARPIETSYDLNELRRRHGYGSAAALAARYDELLKKGVAYWSDAAVSIVMSHLDGQLKEAIAGGRAEPSALPALSRLEAGADWPR